MNGLETRAKISSMRALVEPTAAQLNATQLQVALLTSEVTTLLQPKLVALPSTVALHRATAGEIARATVTLFNNSDLSNLVITNIPGKAGDFTIDAPAGPQTLGPTESLVISVTFNPTGAGPKSADLLVSWTVTGTDTLPPVKVHLTGDISPRQ